MYDHLSNLTILDTFHVHVPMKTCTYTSSKTDTLAVYVTSGA